MNSSEYRPEFNLAAFHKFMLESEAYVKVLSRSEKIDIVRQQCRKTSKTEKELLIKAKFQDVELEHS